MLPEFQPDAEFASQMDRQDPLAPFRSQFCMSDPDSLYMDGNSLGRLPLVASKRLREVVEQEWGQRLVRSWGEGWWEAPRRVGDKIAALVGAAAGQVAVTDSVSIDLFKLAGAALAFQPAKTRLITDTLNFPSDLYILQGLVHGLGDRHQIIRIGSKDGDVTPDLEALARALDKNTALVTLSHVVFKSGYLYDMAQVTQMAHQQGALVLWDLSHSAGVVPVELDACGVDLAIGCTYKYLNGGPGAPAFLYVNKSLQEKLISPIWGWWGQKEPFAFDLDYSPTAGIGRFLAGTQPILSLLAMEAGLQPTLEAGLGNIRRKSFLLTEYFIHLFDTYLAPLGFRLGSPRLAERRGSHVSIRHPEGYRINRALIEEMKVIPDFRDPDNIRLGLVPLYTSFAEVHETVRRTRAVMEEKRYLKYTIVRETVT